MIWFSEGHEVFIGAGFQLVKPSIEFLLQKSFLRGGKTEPFSLTSLLNKLVASGLFKTSFSIPRRFFWTIFTFPSWDKPGGKSGVGLISSSR